MPWIIFFKIFIFFLFFKEVKFLKRVEMAGIKLGGLKRGEVRPLKPYEVEHLKALVSIKL